MRTWYAYMYLYVSIKTAIERNRCGGKEPTKITSNVVVRCATVRQYVQGSQKSWAIPFLKLSWNLAQPVVMAGEVLFLVVCVCLLR